MRNVVIVVAIIVVLLLVLGSCGVDGPPERPSAPRTPAQTSVAISGDATIGVATE